jgi:hypothetical protein
VCVCVCVCVDETEGTSTGNSENSLKDGSSCGASLYMGASLGEPGGGVSLLGDLKVMKERLWGQASVFMGAQLGNLERAHLPGTLRGG